MEPEMWISEEDYANHDCKAEKCAACLQYQEQWSWRTPTFRLIDKRCQSLQQQLKLASEAQSPYEALKALIA